MGKITIRGDNSPAGILRHWERKTKQDCAREILRCWQERDTLRARAEKAEARCAELEHICDAVLSDLEILDESAGVAGWHLNGEVATWEEVGFAYTREALKSTANKPAGKPWLLRKQADAVDMFGLNVAEGAVDDEHFEDGDFAAGDIQTMANREAERLRTQAAEMEKGDG